MDAPENEEPYLDGCHLAPIHSALAPDNLYDSMFQNKNKKNNWMQNQYEYKPFLSSSDVDSMLASLRYTFMNWFTKTDSELRDAHSELKKARNDFEEEKIKEWNKFQETIKYEREAVQDYRRKMKSELASEISLMQKERDEARENAKTERLNFLEEKESLKFELNLEKQRVAQDMKMQETIKKQILDINIATDTRVDLNVGGVIMQTSRHVLLRQPNSLLAARASGNASVVWDKAGNMFFDRDPVTFSIILNFLRNPICRPFPRNEVESQNLIAEAEYYGIKFFPAPQAYIIGGTDGVDYLRSVEVLDSYLSHWRPTSPLNTERAYMASCNIRQEIYVYGGQNYNYKALSETEIFDAMLEKWSIGPGLLIPRRNLCGTFFNGRIYAIGGFDGHCILSSVESYDPRTKGWMEVTPLSTPRSSACCAVSNQQLFVFGGTKGQRIQSVELFDERMNSWITVGDMHEIRSAACGVAANDVVYSFGGADATGTTLQSAEHLVNGVSEWNFIASMPCPRMDAACACNEHSVLVCGGRNDEVLNSADMYHSPTDTWSAAPNLIQQRFGHTCCFVDV